MSLCLDPRRSSPEPALDWSRLMSGSDAWGPGPRRDLRSETTLVASMPVPVRLRACSTWCSAFSRPVRLLQTGQRLCESGTGGIAVLTF